MLSTLLLESRPRTFTTAQYRDAAGLDASSASRALGALVDSGQVRTALAVVTVISDIL